MVKEEIFKNTPVPKAVLKLVAPTVVSQIILLLYNWSDTFFVAKAGSADEVAAVTICLPALYMLTAIANLFGAGGASFIARSLGEGDKEKARKTAAFSFWASLVVAVIFSAAVYFSAKPLLKLLGGDGGTGGFAYDYLFWTVVVGGLPAVASSVLSQLIRAEGSALQASIGPGLGGVINIALGAAFVLPGGLGLGVKGAGLATLAANTAAALYFIIYLIIARKKSVITLNPKNICFRKEVVGEVLAIGVPAFLLSFLSTVSNVATNKFVSGYGASELAAMGVAKRVNMTNFALIQGLVQGVLPLIAYNYSSGDKKRMKKALLFTAALAAGISAVCLTLDLTLSERLVSIFIKEEGVISSGGKFLRIMSLAVPTSAINFLINTVFQATGKKLPAFITSVLRKGTLDVGLMIWFQKLMGITGVVWATPAAELISAIAAAAVLLFCLKKLKNQSSA